MSNEHKNMLDVEQLATVSGGSTSSIETQSEDSENSDTSSKVVTFPDIQPVQGGPHQTIGWSAFLSSVFGFGGN